MSYRIEEKQRSTRRRREAEAEAASNKEGVTFKPYEAKWFRKVKDDDNEGFDHFMHVFKGDYWTAKEKQDWNGCADIF